MISLIFLLSTAYIGFIFSKVFSFRDTYIQLISFFITGSLISVTFIYFWTSFVTRSLNSSLTVFFLLTLFFLIIELKRKGIKKFPIVPYREVLFPFVALLLSLYIFSKGFSYDSDSMQFLIASNTYLDFGVHIPFIRSFSQGSNFPMQVPFFAGEVAFYHFMFDLYAGILEYLGLRIDHAFNLISALALSGVMLMIYKLSFLLFNKTSTAIFSVTFFIFGSSLSFLEFFQKNGFNLSSFWHNSFYQEAGPLGDKTIGVFWTLNAYLNQRQLIFGILFLLFLIYVILSKKQLDKKELLLLSLLISLLPFWHTTMFLAVYILLVGFFLFIPNLRKSLFLLGTTSLVFTGPILFFISRNVSHAVIFYPGFLVSQSLTLQNLFSYWFWNLGFLLPTIIFAFIISSSVQKRFFLSVLILFLVPNLFQISADIYDNHKFLNLWLILVIPFSAFFVTWLLEKSILYKLGAGVVIFFLTISGFLNFMVAKNDVLTRIDDYPKHKLTKWLYKNIPSQQIVVTNGEIYDPLSLMGYKTYLGRSYYIHTYGYNPYLREEKLSKFLSSTSSDLARVFLEENKISHVILYKGNFAKNPRSFNEPFFRHNFHILYEDNSGIVIKI